MNAERFVIMRRRALAALASFLIALPTSPVMTFAQPLAAGDIPAAPAAIPADTSTARQQAYVFNSPAGRLPYLLYLPKDYGADPNKQWPMLVFLHGSTEAGRNAEILKRQALPKILEGKDDFPFVVLSPQSPTSGGWAYSTRAFKALLDDVQAHYQIDPDRISLTGWSMGGYGVWWMARAMPDRFAALVPVAGGYIYNAKQLCSLSKVPTWVFHGKKDRNVQFVQSQLVVNALKQCGGAPIFTEYADAEHYLAMNRAYTDPQLFEWLLAQKRGQAAPAALTADATATPAATLAPTATPAIVDTPTAPAPTATSVVLDTPTVSDITATPDATATSAAP